jgi:hypothetical protein
MHFYDSSTTVSTHTRHDNAYFEPNIFCLLYTLHVCICRTPNWINPVLLHNLNDSRVMPKRMRSGVHAFPISTGGLLSLCPDLTEHLCSFLTPKESLKCLVSKSARHVFLRIIWSTIVCPIEEVCYTTAGKTYVRPPLTGIIRHLDVDIYNLGLLKLIHTISGGELISLKFGVGFNRLITRDMLPFRLQKLTFCSEFNQPMSKNVFPDNMSELEFGRDFDQPIADGVLPASLKKLTFGASFGQPITEGMLHVGLSQLTFGDFFNQPFGVGVLPPGLKQLTVGRWFNQPFVEGVLPGSLTHLTLGMEFNQPILKGVFPVGLTHLSFGDDFNQPISPGVLPLSLTHLTFGKRFNQPIAEGMLPGSLTHVTFGMEFNRPISEGSTTSLERRNALWLDIDRDVN